ncbi:MAG: hypothetical protein PHR57_00150 [Patescibacteria group bacterium]|nr:hypothetical protein [Patescibacteria group bacterium]
MFEKPLNTYESQESFDQVKESIVCGYRVGINSPFKFCTDSLDAISSDIPDAVINNLEKKDNKNFDGNVNFVESSEDGLKWDEEKKELTIFGNPSCYESGNALIYKSVQVAEYLRQLDGQLTAHGAAVRFQNGKSVVIMGNSGAGKTSAVVSLCQKYGAELIGNDQVVFDSKEKLQAVGGTKDLVIRKTATKRNLPDLANLFDSQENSWKTKRKLKPSELNINICTEPSDICAIVWIQIDTDIAEPTYVRKILETDIVDTLNLSEKFSRQISGVQSPLVDDNGKVRSFGISLDNDKTRRTRVEVLNKFREVGIYYLFGSNLDEVSSAIKHLSEI